MFTVQAKWEEEAIAQNSCCVCGCQRGGQPAHWSPGKPSHSKPNGGVKKGKLIESLKTKELKSLPH